MAKQVIVEDGIAYEVEEEGSVGDPLMVASNTEPSGEPESGAKPAERATTAPSTPRRAAPLVDVKVVDVPDSDPVEDLEVEDIDDDELDELEGTLDEWLESFVNEKVGKVQSVKDREISKLVDSNKTLAKELQDIRDQIEESKLAGLSEEERLSYQDTKAIERRKAELDEVADELEKTLKVQLVTAYVADYGQYGVTADDLEGIDDPDEMERFCDQAELKFYRSGKTLPKETEVVPAPKAKARAAVPAGASAPADLGGTSPALTQQKEPSTGTGLEAMALTLKSLPLESVRIG